jgi:hypothetical protein
VHELVELERLRHEIRGAALDRVHRVLHGAEAGHHDDDDLRVPRDRVLEHLAAVDARQAQVGDHDVEGELGQPLDGLFPVGRLHHLEAVLGQAFGHHGPECRLVFDDQEMFCVFSHLDERRYFDTSSARGPAPTRQAACNPCGCRPGAYSADLINR